MTNLASALCTYTDKPQLSVGKISMASEPAGKTRMFAICNFWIQSVLKPFHDQLMTVLRLFPADGTFNQIAQFNRILKKSKGRMTYCYDLSKATDRFPLILQQTVFEVIIGTRFAKAWSDLISCFPFHFNGHTYV
jgi:hypothetical protein